MKDAGAFSFSNALNIYNMGRELKRIALNFKWPIGMIWKGYINPFRWFECSACKGTGLNPSTKKMGNSSEWQ